MKIALIDLKDPRDLVVDKTIAGGMGTATRYGSGLFGNLLTRVKARMIRLLPYNVAYVAALLKSQGLEVCYRTKVYPLDYDAAVVFSAIPSIDVDQACLKILRSYDIPAVVTGTIVNVAPELYADAAVVVNGEPEAFFQDPAWPERLKGWRDEPGRRIDVGQVAELDSLPFPDWSIFPSLSSSYAIVAPGRTVLPMVTSRGCPYPCGYYCPYPLGEGKAMRYRSAAAVVDELRHLQGRYGVEAVKFRDPIFTVNRKRTLELLEALAAADLGVTWGCETHLAQLDEPLLRRMAETGCRLIQTGIETTNPAALKASRRKSAEQLHQERMLELCQELGIKTALYFIVGLPEDTVEGMRASLDYASSLPGTFIQITACTPYPGTKFFHDIQERLTTRSWRDLDQYRPVIRSDHFRDEDLLELMSYGYRRFYLRKPWLEGFLSVHGRAY